MNRRVLALMVALAAAIVIIIRLATPDSTDPDAATADPARTPLTSVATPAAGGGDPSAAAVATPGNTGAATAPPEHDPNVIDDDSTRDGEPGTAGGTGDPTSVATAFAQAWTRHTGPDAGTWAERVGARSTPSLAGKLRPVDPAVVPADTVTGAALVTATTTWADAVIPTDAGTLRLTLIYTGRWHVNTLDWQRAPR